IGTWVNFRLAPTRLSLSYSRLLCHDWVKFLPAEFFPYVDFYSKDPSKRPAADRVRFAQAFRHHYQRMDHHYEHFLEPSAAVLPEQAAVSRPDCVRYMPVECV